MLSFNTVASTKNFIDLKPVEKNIVPVPNTPLSRLVTLSTPDFIQINDKDVEVLASVVSQYTTGNIEVATQHSSTMDALLKDICPLVTTHIAFARNVVRDKVSQYADDIIQYLQDTKLPDPGSNFNIISCKYHELYKNEDFLDSIKYAKGGSYVTPLRKFTLPEKTHEELVEYLTTGNKATDELVFDLVSSLQEGDVCTVYDEFFGTGSCTIKENNIFISTSKLTIALLLSRKLFDEVQSVNGVSKEEYENYMVDVRNYCSKTLCSNIEMIAAATKNQTMVISFNQGYGGIGNTIYVNSELYNEWLEKEAGSPEVLFGMVVDGNYIGNKNLINEKKEELLRKWNTYVSFTKVSNENSKFSKYISFLKNSFTVFINDTKTPEEVKLFEERPEVIKTINELGYKQIDSLTTADMEDPYNVGLMLMAKCRFYYTPSYNILHDIYLASSVNPDVDVREAALLAAINYVSDYVANQIVYRK